MTMGLLKAAWRAGSGDVLAGVAWSLVIALSMLYASWPLLFEPAIDETSLNWPADR
jgi:hypothetical protein